MGNLYLSLKFAIATKRAEGIKSSWAGKVNSLVRICIVYSHHGFQ